MEKLGVHVKLFSRYEHGERNVPHLLLQKAMYQYLVRNLKKPGTCVVISGDGGMNEEGESFMSVRNDMLQNGWKVELLSCKRCVAGKLQGFVESCGIFVALNSHKLLVTYLHPNKSEEGVFRDGRQAKLLDLEKRPM